MTSSLHGKQDAKLRIASSEDAIVFPENVEATDDTPTVISKAPPVVEPATQQQNLNQIIDLSRQALTPDSLIASLRGRKLAHYELIEPIGVGGMAAVLRARDTQLDRFVALKILPPEMAMDNENIRRFHQEAKAAAKLDHENIARVFFCGEDQGLHFIAFEFVEGMNLRTLLEQRGKLPVAEAIRYVLQIATGLEHATTRNVVHRDVKPSNIIITPTGRAKLVDMGLARNMERQGERDLTQSGVTLGTFDYISPEQALEPREADGRSDVYSLGCTLYHMLTGQPPVPEGTPAKKLHHHQHLLPIDPRQSNPAIPDEVVLVLGKMMAKNPKDRYQRPIHLVQHLMQVAQKVGVADDLPEGILFVDAPLPSEPRTRPLLVIGMALAALIVVTLLLSLAPTPPTQNFRPTNPPANNDKIVSAGDRQEAKPLNPERGPVFVTSQSVEVKDAAGLQEALTRPAKELHVRLSAEEMFLGNPAVTFKGASDQRLEIEPKDQDTRPIIRFIYALEGPTAGLVLEGAERIVIRRFKFQMDSIVNPKKDVVASVLVRGVKHIIFEQCIFTQEQVPDKVPTGHVALASLLVDAVKGSKNPKPIVTLRDCYFGGDGKTVGQDAIVLNGPATVYATSCAFKPHAAFFHFRAESKLHDTEVQLRRCAGFVMQGPVFRFDEKASAKLKVEQSVFSNLNTTVSLLETSRPDVNMVQYETPRPDLIFLSDNSLIQYVGRKNLYYNLNALVERKNTNPLSRPLFLTKLEEFKNYLGQVKGSSDLDSNDLSSSPWQCAEPLVRKDELAFQLKAQYAGSNRVDGYGLEGTWMARLMPEPPPLVKAPVPTTKQMIVDAEDKTPGVYKTIQNALGEAENGDEILIRCGKENREVKVAPVNSLRANISVTLKADKGYKPILVPDKERFLEADAYLFKVQASTLTFEDLEFLLDPGKSTFRAESIVQLGETGQCSFKNCVLTLKNTGEGNNETPLKAVTFLATDGMMKMDGPVVVAGPSKVEFDGCFVRGRGDLVSLRGCRLLNVEVKNSLIALDNGSLLDIQANDKNLPMDQGVQWKMDRSTIFSTKSLFNLRCAFGGKGLTTTRANVEGCLLVALGMDLAAPVVLPLDARPEDKYLEWEGNKNFYANFPDQLSQWKRQFQTDNFVEGKLTFAKVEDVTKNLWNVMPDMLKPMDSEIKQITNYGVPTDVEQRWFAPGTKEE